MITVPRTLFAGTLAELQTRVQAFKDARTAHGGTVGVPAPREADFIERLASTGEAYDIEDPLAVIPPTPVEQAEIDRRNSFRSAIAGDSVLTQLKAMSNTEFEAWWDSNVTSAAAVIAILKRLVRVVILRIL